MTEELLREGVAQGDWVVMIAYGAGISAHAYLLRNEAAVVPI